MRQGTLSIVALVSPEYEGVNLDDQWADDLLDFARDVNENAEGVAALVFPSMPEGYVDATLRLGVYAASKCEAMKARQAGKLRKALRLEALCEMRYKLLPTFAQW